MKVQRGQSAIMSLYKRWKELFTMTPNKSQEQYDSIWSDLVKSGNAIVEPVQTPMDLTDRKRFIKIEPGILGGLSAVTSQIPSIAETSAMYGMYTVKFPNGISGTLTPLKQGGYGSMLRDSSGTIVGHASFFPAPPYAAVFAVFTVMAIASQQFFLTLIFKKLDIISKKLDKILDFLYSDKSAELMSEINFIQRAYKNYNSIMNHESQRIATISSIQNAEKVAMKDIEFYIKDLDSTSNQEWKYDRDGLNTLKTFIENCNNLSEALQLYILSCIMEAYYSMNFDHKTIDDLKQSLEDCLDFCFRRMNSVITAMKTNIEKTSQSKKLDKYQDLKVLYDNLASAYNVLNQKGQSTELRNSISEALDAPFQEQKYIIHNNDIYYCIPNE